MARILRIRIPFFLNIKPQALLGSQLKIKDLSKLKLFLLS